MSATPPPDILAYRGGGSNHTFFASSDICSDCHEEIIDAEVLETIVEEIMYDIQGQIEEALLAYIGDQTALGNVIDLNGAATITDVDDVTEIVFGEFRGRQSMTVTLTDGMTYGPFRMNDVDIIQPAPLPTVAFYDLADEGLIKAGWNYNLIHNDGSHGIHNPTFTLAVLDAARDFVGGGGGPRTRLPF